MITVRCDGHEYTAVEDEVSVADLRTAIDAAARGAGSPWIEFESSTGPVAIRVHAQTTIAIMSTGTETGDVW